MARVADLKNFQQAAFYSVWLGIAPDDSPFFCATQALRKFTLSIGWRGDARFSTRRERGTASVWRTGFQGLVVGSLGLCARLSNHFDQDGASRC